MRESPNISVIMPMYNGIRTVDRAVDSLFGQTFAGWELIAVDDCSTDDTYEHLEERSRLDSRIHVLRTEQNCGAGAARNFAIRNAMGDFITYLDCDDEYYADYLERVDQFRRKGDVLFFGYDYVQEYEGVCGPKRAWDPTPYRGHMFARNLSVPLGVAHRRDLLARIGVFNETLVYLEDWDFWRRLARAGAEFLYLPFKSGLYHMHAGSQSTAPRITQRQRAAFQRFAIRGGALYCNSSPTPPRNDVRRIVFASPHCLIDFSNGAAVATSDALELLGRCGFECRALCSTQSDLLRSMNMRQLFLDLGLSFKILESVVGGQGTRFFSTEKGAVQLTVVEGLPSFNVDAAPARFLSFFAAFEKLLAEFEPQVFLTYGGDALVRSIVELAKRRDMTVVFGLHNLAYDDVRIFTTVDYVLVPSEFARRHYWDKLGLACQVLVSPINWNRVRAERRGKPQYLAFVNPQPAKGLFVFARIAEQIARRRPDIPVLVVESRGQASWLEQTNLDLSWVDNLHAMENTPDPRDFYRVTNLLLMPSLVPESFGLVAAEAMINGIPVLASNRGALPEILRARDWGLGVGEEGSSLTWRHQRGEKIEYCESGGFVIDIPERYTPEAMIVPTAEEVEPWVETIIRLWDDEALYRECSERARRHAQQWHPDRLGPIYAEFFRNVRPQPGPPIVPKEALRDERGGGQS